MECLKQMFQQEDTKDFKFSVGGNKSVMVHKFILINRCDYFKKMLEHDTVEKSKNGVIIEDFDLETIQSFIRYLYTDAIEWTQDLAEQMLILADKYCMNHLKGKCEQCLIKTIKVTRAIDLLIIADKYNCKSLKSKALSNIKDNIGTIKNSVDWQKLQELPSLKDDIIDKLIPPIKRMKELDDLDEMSVYGWLSSLHG